MAVGTRAQLASAPPLLRPPSTRTTRSRGEVAVLVVAAVLVLVALLLIALDAALPDAATVLLTTLVVLTQLRPADLVRSRRGGGDARRPVPVGLGFLVALLATAPLSCALLACGLPLLLRAARRTSSPALLLVVAVRSAAVVLGARLALAVTLGAPLTGGPLITRQDQWPAVLVAGLVAVAVDVVLRTATRAGAGRDSDARSVGLADRVRLTVVGLVLVMTAPALTIAANGGVLLLLAVSLPVLLVRLTTVIPRRAGRRVLSDPLTGLPNREALHARLEEVLAAAPDGAPGPGLLVLDLDHFKDVNDALGHPAGDAALREVARRLVARSPRDTLVARVGGDEFALLVDDGDRAEELADAVVQEMSRPLRLGGRQVLLPASVGIALAPQHGPGATALLRHADVALHQAKEVRGRACVYAAERGEEGAERVRLLGDLARAVEDSQLRVVYQPQVDPRTGALLGVEALVRWEHPVLGPVSPDRFIPLAEHSGLIRRVTEVVLETALGDAAGWRTAGFPGVTVAVNVSARLLSEEGLPALVTAALDRHGLEAGALVVEITETHVLADPERARAVVRDLRTLGCAVAVDDYGTGQSSLAHLAGLEVDELKIDRCFVTGMTSDRSLQVIVRSTVAMSRDLGLRVVAEGVEDGATQRALAGFGCHAVQGRFVGEPTTAAGVLARLRAPRPAAVPDVVATPAPRGALPAER
ncbi:putative bifunctional diguanylate cyclase/phosphodiesterase [Kineococcus rubinsiae]|uniref:putative bifunctional diguanylate cyclase/phosphodiesterase n=1 Tax=Kineococcus rubinsiae TaxID=2609562 RepID=UPI001431674F|nr:EAL domain-containing protein [Kineococcus rubinsiae]NIZ90889.1 EAL domain-containing protein [Kineococcus rubinsiae]